MCGPPVRGGPHTSASFDDSARRVPQQREHPLEPTDLFAQRRDLLLELEVADTCTVDALEQLVRKFG